MITVDWQEISLVVFDVDGTLYDQRCLRFKMVQELMGHCLRHPGDLRVLQLISQFRRSREELAEEEVANIADLQYQRPAEKLGVEPGDMRRQLEVWMFERPLRHLRPCRYPTVDALMDTLRESGKTVAVLSDYPADAKLQALELAAELAVSAVDPEVDRLKPHPRGLQRILELAGVEPSQALLIGDREDRDGECARRAGVAYLIRSSHPKREAHQFKDYGELVRSLSRQPARDAALQ